MCSLASIVQVSLRGCGASCWSWYTLEENSKPLVKRALVRILIAQKKKYNCCGITYSKTSTLGACIRHDLRTEKSRRTFFFLAIVSPSGEILFEINNVTEQECRRCKRQNTHFFNIQSNYCKFQEFSFSKSKSRYIMLYFMLYSSKHQIPHTAHVVTS